VTTKGKGTATIRTLENFSLEVPPVKFYKTAVITTFLYDDKKTGN
jgi:hypothetical protein